MMFSNCSDSCFVFSCLMVVWTLIVESFVMKILLSRYMEAVFGVFFLKLVSCRVSFVCSWFVGFAVAMCLSFGKDHFKNLSWWLHFVFSF